MLCWKGSHHLSDFYHQPCDNWLWEHQYLEHSFGVRSSAFVLMHICSLDSCRDKLWGDFWACSHGSKDAKYPVLWLRKQSERNSKFFKAKLWSLSTWHWQCQGKKPMYQAFLLWIYLKCWDPGLQRFRCPEIDDRFFPSLLWSAEKGSGELNGPPLIPRTF